MKLIQPSVEFLGEVTTDYEGNLRFIERAGRTCYKSESKGDPEKFVRKLITSGHLAMVEHSNFVVRCKTDNVGNFYELQSSLGKYLNIEYSHWYVYVGGNLTAWYNLSLRAHYNNVQCLVPFKVIFGMLFSADNSVKTDDSLWSLTPHSLIPVPLRRYSVKFICNRAVSHELVRHRPCSFAQESQRYVNYGGKDMEFIEPVGFDDWTTAQKNIFTMGIEDCEDGYKELLAFELKPQQARSVLPNATKTEIIVTADAAEWAHIKKLRTAKDADPEMQRVMNMVPWEEIL